MIQSNLFYVVTALAIYVSSCNSNTMADPGNSSEDVDNSESCNLDCNSIDWSGSEASIKAVDFFVIFDDDVYTGNSDIEVVVSNDGAWGEGLYLIVNWEELGYTVQIEFIFLGTADNMRCLKDVSFSRDESRENGVGGFGYGYDCDHDNDPETDSGEILVDGKLEVDRLHIDHQLGHEIYFQNLEISVAELARDR